MRQMYDGVKFIQSDAMESPIKNVNLKEELETIHEMYEFRVASR